MKSRYLVLPAAALLVASAALLGSKRSPTPVDPYETRVSSLGFALIKDGLPGIASAHELAEWASPVLARRGADVAFAASDVLGLEGATPMEMGRYGVQQMMLRGRHPQVAKRELDAENMMTFPLLRISATPQGEKRIALQATVRLAARPPTLERYPKLVLNTVYRESTVVEVAPGQSKADAVRQALPRVLDDYGARIGAARRAAERRKDEKGFDPLDGFRWLPAGMQGPLERDRAAEHKRLTAPREGERFYPDVARGWAKVAALAR